MAVTFEQFWNLYGYKLNRKKTEQKWNRLTAKERRAAVDGIQRLKDYYAEKGYALPHPLTYLNGERWNDEYPENGNVNDNVNDNGNGNVNDNVNDNGNSDELAALEALKADLLKKEPAKPYRWQQFTELVNNIILAYVENGIVHLNVLINGKPERITEYMIDYFDSYSDFYRLLTSHFKKDKVSFDV